MNGPSQEKVIDYLCSLAIFFAASPLRRGGRVAECGGLLNRCTG